VSLDADALVCPLGRMMYDEDWTSSLHNDRMLRLDEESERAKVRQGRMTPNELQ
jgi:hypothetical protein